METTSGGLRERKKEATREALHDAAMRLAVEHGLQEVTVEAIADAAGVSRRTFSNYFGGKEEALLYGDERRMQNLLERFIARPCDESSWAALRGSLHAMLAEEGERDPRWVAQARLAREHPSVMAQQLAHWASLERTFADLIAVRDGLPSGGARPRAMAGAFMAALRIAAIVWTDERPPRPLAEIADDLLQEMARPFG
ncbi:MULTISPECIES: TetR/AcrR family transcriptional regulator [Actinomadura]|uniref:TetR family transcriptional regulator n=1 Tax=Actinomadura litoris TaxID=2678616 RepID=A0A7K1L1F7_9ACTN|nr:MULTISPECIES: TetR/AcrR family transcriptional regulator [Actinomadura]MBT2206616.1 TetR family transcriptional regulator [Actinomadura sp. NEAU-AAG7]MUN38284.1 TetR family transcriptional regulator [Actinomadura litoris]